MRWGRVLLLCASACGAGDDAGGVPDAIDHLKCVGIEEPWMPGMSRLGDAGSFRLQIMSADPDPLQTGNNAFTVLVTDAGDAPVDGAAFDPLQAWSYTHQHSSPVKPEVMPGAAPGVYEIVKMNVLHKGSWQFQFGIDAEGMEDYVEFHFCVEGDV